MMQYKIQIIFNMSKLITIDRNIALLKVIVHRSGRKKKYEYWMRKFIYLKCLRLGACWYVHRTG